jgi:hypothetical protein
MSPTAASRARPADVFTSALNAAVGGAAATLGKKVDAWTDKLEGFADAGLDQLAEGRGAADTAGAEGIKARLRGKNPVWPAIRGAWQAGTPVVRAAIIAGVASAILLLLLAPVPLLVFLLSLLVIAAAQKARAAKR